MTLVGLSVITISSGICSVQRAQNTEGIGARPRQSGSLAYFSRMSTLPLRNPLPHLPQELAGHCVYRASSDGVDENLLVLLHGLGDTAGAALLSLVTLRNSRVHAL